MKNLIPMPKAISTSGYIILAMLLSLPFAAAQERFINALSGAQIVNNAVFTVSDDKFASLPIAGSTTVSVEDRVVLEIDEDALVAKTSSNITLTLSVRLWTGPAGISVPLSSIIEIEQKHCATAGTGLTTLSCPIKFVLGQGPSPLDIEEDTPSLPEQFFPRQRLLFGRLKPC